MSTSKIILTSRDLRLVEDLTYHDDMDIALASVLRQKLHAATVVLPEDVPADVVTLDSRVRYLVDGRPDERRLIASPSREFRGQTLLVNTPLGATLLGMRAGDVAAAVAFDGTPARVEVISVLYQPELDRHRSHVARIDEAGSRIRTISSGRRPVSTPTWDDPGPSAA